MQLKLDKRFWVVITCIIVVFTIFIVGRNLLHAIEIRKDIAILEQERAIYRARIEQDSTLLEELKYDDNLEQFARERYRMQRRGRKSISWNEAAFEACRESFEDMGVCHKGALLRHYRDAG